MATNNNAPATKVIVPCRISFANIWEARSINGSEEKYSVSCLIPKSDKATLTKIKKAIEAAKEAAKDKKWGGKLPANLKLPMHDGDIDRPDDENYAGHFFFNATSKDAPQIVDRHVQPILDPMECGSGDYCNVSDFRTSSLSVMVSVLRADRPQHPTSLRSRAMTRMISQTMIWIS